MKQILESMLDELEWLSKNASSWEYYLGKYDLCKELLSQCDEMMCSSQEDAYDDYYANQYGRDYDDADEFYCDPLEMHYSELAWYKQEEMDNMYNTCNHFTRGLGQSVINLDSYWFTSDEIEAFREIWQRRLSA
jgi:hypothetical protein